MRMNGEQVPERDPGVVAEAGADPAAHWIARAERLDRAAAEVEAAIAGPDDKFLAKWCRAQAAGYRAVAEKEGNIAAYAITSEGGGRPPKRYVIEGLCGFAWITVPGNRPFGRWAGRNGWDKGYPKGRQYWVSNFGQSAERKEAFAYAAARHLREVEGIKDAYAGSRLD